MKLNTAERLNLLNLLPREGDFTTLKILREVKEELSFSEEEHKEGKFITAGNRTTWDNTKVREKEVVIGEKVTSIIVAALKKLDSEKKLHESHMSLYEKFVESPILKELEKSLGNDGKQ